MEVTENREEKEKKKKKNTKKDEKEVDFGEVLVSAYLVFAEENGRSK